MDIILRYFNYLTQHQQNQFLQLGTIYKFWNERINVISRKDIDYLYERHILHSLSIVKFFNFVPGTRILDVGTGGGFPGIPLAIIFPQVKFVLLDSVKKKLNVVNEVIKELNLKNVTTIQVRIERYKDNYDFITGRAITEFPKYVKWVINKVRPDGINTFPNGIIYLKGGNFENEIKSFHDQIIIYNISDFFNEEYFKTKKIIYLPILNYQD